MVFGKLISANRELHQRALLTNIRCKQINTINIVEPTKATNNLQITYPINSLADETTIIVNSDITTRPVTFLVDTGSSISLINASVIKKDTSIDCNKKVELISATGHNTSTIASCTSKLNINNNILQFVFHVYDGNTIPIKYDGILGYDFMHSFNCMIDLQNNILTFNLNDNLMNREFFDNGKDVEQLPTKTAGNEKCNEDDDLELSMKAFNIAANSTQTKEWADLIPHKKKNKKCFSFVHKDHNNKSYVYPMYTNTKLCTYLKHLYASEDVSYAIHENTAMAINFKLKLPNGTYVFNNTSPLPKVSIPDALIRVDNFSTLLLVKNMNNFPVHLNASILSNARLEEASKYQIFQISKSEDSNVTSERIKFIEAALNFDGSLEEIKNDVISLCKKYNDCFHIPGDKISHTDVITHKIILKPDAVPKFIKQYRIPESQKSELQRQLNEMEDQNIIEKSTSTGWNSPIILVPKCDEQGNKTKFRLVVDFRKLNEATVPLQFPIPSIDSIIDRLSNSKIFSTLDLHGAFYQIKLEETSRPLTTFENNNFTYRFKSMPQGLHTSPATMQNAVNLMFKDLLNNGVNVYFDDVLIYTNTADAHLSLLEKVFILLRKHRFKLKIEKCKFLRTQVNYLGYIINQDGCLPNPNKIECIIKYPTPKNVTETQRFLGMANYFRKYVRNYAFLAKPMYNLLRKGQAFLWDSKCTASFESLKTALTTPPVLIFPNFNEVFIITTDASNVGVAAVLSQGNLPNDRPIQFCSKVLNGAQRNYSTIEKELYAIVYATEMFRHYILGVHFLLYTDHRPLVHLFNLKNPTSRLYRWRMALSEFTFKIVYKRGSQNTVADALSRIEPLVSLESTELIQQPDNKPVLAITRSKAKQLSADRNSQTHDDITSTYNIEENNNILTNSQSVDHIFFLFDSENCELKRKLEYKLKTNIIFPQNFLPCLPHKFNDDLTFFLMPPEKYETERIAKLKLLLNTILDICTRYNYQDIAVNIDMKNPKQYFEFKFIFKVIFAPSSIITKFYLNKVMEVFELDQILEILNSYHNSSLAGHTSFGKAKNAIRRYFSWPSMDRDIKQFIDNCDICKKSKITRHTHSPMIITSTAEFPFQKVYIDFVNVERQHSNTYPCIFTCIDELTKYAIAVRAKNSTALLAAKKFVKHVVLKFNIPESVVSDQGAAFLSETFKEITKLFKIKKITTTPYRPNANIVERFHRTLAQHLIACVHINPLSWHEHLDSAVFAYNNSLNSATAFSPHQLLFGFRVQLPSSITRSDSIIYNYDNYKDELQRTLRAYWKTAKENIEYKKIQNKKQRDKNANPLNINVGDQVYLKKPFKEHKFATPYDGPFTIEEILSPVTVKIKTKNNKIITTHTDKLKPH